jgi:hypothetical protein
MTDYPIHTATKLRAYPEWRGIGGDNALLIADGFDHWVLAEYTDNAHQLFPLLRESFRTRGGAVRRANQLLAEEESYSGIEHERF